VEEGEPTMPTKNNDLTKGYPVALIAAAVLSTTAILIRYLTVTYQIPALLLAFWRDLFVGLSLLPVFAILRPVLLRIERKNVGYLILYGLVLACFNSLWTISVALNGAAVATVLVYCSAAFTALLGRWLLNERLNVGKILAILLCLGGCVLVSGALDLTVWQTGLMGITTGVVAGLGYAGYSLMGRQAAQGGLSPWTSLFYTFSFAALFLLVFNLLLNGLLPGAAVGLGKFFWLGQAWEGWAVLIVLAAVPTVIGFGLYNVSLSYLPSSVANLIVTLEPVFTATTAYLLLGERLSGVQVVGSLMILGGVVCLRIFDGWMAGRHVMGAAEQA
jgi:drug/metabolite transporter (DMT)-like permease